MATRIVLNVLTGQQTIETYTPDPVTPTNPNAPITSSVNLTAANSSPFVDTTNGNITIGLPPAANFFNQELSFIKVVAPNTLTFTSSSQIQGQATLVITDMGSVVLTSDGVNWWIK